MGKDPGGGCGGSMVGNPIDVRSGNKYEEHHDLSLASAVGKPPLAFTRYYNSRSTAVSPLGYGWSHSYCASLQYVTTDGGYPYLKIADETGRGYYFPSSNQSYWYSTFHEKTKVLQAADGYTWFKADGTESGFDLNGKLVWTRDPLGNRHLISYDTSGRIWSVTDESSGRSLTFHYTPSGLLDHISGPATPAIADGIWVSYAYDANGNLTGVTYADGSGFVFEYNDPYDPHNLTAKKDKLNHLLAAFSYDAQDRAYASTTRDGRGVTIDYGSDGTVQVTDAYGIARTYGITKFEGLYPRLTSITGAGGCQTCAGDEPVRYAYDAQLNITEEEYSDGTINKYQDYDERGNPRTVIFAAGTTAESVITFTYHPEISRPLTMSKASVLGPGNQVTIWDYDGDGNTIPNEAPTRLVSRIIQQGYTISQGAIVPYEHITTYSRNAVGQVTSVDGPLPGTDDLVGLTYDPVNGNLLTTAQPVVGTITFGNYDGAGNPGRLTDLNSQVTTFAYDGKNRLVSSTINGVTSSTAYNAAGEIESVTDGAGRTMAYAYDGVRGLLERITDPTGNYQLYAHDAQGNRTEDSSYDAANVVHRWQGFDYHNPVDPGKLWRIINPNGTATVLEYNAMDNLSRVTDPEGKITQYQYDPMERLSLMTEPGATVTRLSYNRDGGVTGVQDAEGRVTSFEYDDLGRRVVESSPDRGATAYEHDAAGNLVARTDGNGVTVAFTYDALNRLTGEIYPDSSQNVTYAYDQGSYGVGRLTGRTDQSGSCAYTYDAFGNLANEQQTVCGVVYTTSYSYDQSGVLTSIGYPQGCSVQYILDSAGRIQGVTWEKPGENPITLASAIDYLPFGPISQMTLGNGVTVELAYDQRYQLTGLTHGSVLDLSYSRDNAGNITAISDNLDASRDRSFSYDSQYRLTEATGVFGAISYSYDKVGNRLIRTSDSGISDAYEYAAATNRLQKISGSTNRRIAYDQAGNPILMAGDIASPIPTADYVANAEGQRIIKTVNGSTTIFHYDQAGNLIAETNPDGTLRRAYVYLDSLRLATIDIAPTGPAQVYYHHNDQLGAPQKLTDATGATVWRADYDPFGQATVDPTSTVENNFRLSGQYFDTETGLHQNWWRTYDPGSGRYLTPDPIGLAGGMNLYSYSNANPINYIDPWGLRWQFSQSTGQWSHVNDQTGAQTPVGTGYSGTGAGRNNPNMQDVPNVGPIPQGTYNIGPGHYSPTTGPNTMNLDPRTGTDTFGRDLFRIHGNNAENDASEGCPIASPDVRRRINNSDDRILEVIP